jgi:DNA alkylation repair enzyme.
MDTILKDVREALAAQGDEARRESAQRFCKEPVRSYGVTTAARSVAKQGCVRLKKSSKQDIRIA